jgi:hypothetical protein
MSWLITYQVSRDHRASWHTFNDAITHSPAQWLQDFYKGMPRWGYTNVVLLNAIPITDDEQKKLAFILES